MTADLLAPATGRVGSADPAGSATAAQQGSLLARARSVQTALVFPPDPRTGPVELPTFAALCDHVRALAAEHGPLTLSLATAHYPGFDPFPAVCVRRGDGFSVAYLADRWADEEDARLALGVLRKAALGRPIPQGSATAAQQEVPAAQPTPTRSAA